jgi:hypothetical protein
VQIEWDGKSWEFDPEDINFRQGEQIYRYYQLTIEAYSDGLDHMDQRSFHVAYWLMRQQAGEKSLGLANCGDVKVVPYMLALTEARLAAAKTEQEAQDAAKAEQDAALDAEDRSTAVGPTSPLPGDPPSPMSAIPPATTPVQQYLPPPPGYQLPDPIVS